MNRQADTFEFSSRRSGCSMLFAKGADASDCIEADAYDMIRKIMEHPDRPEIKPNKQYEITVTFEEL